MKFDKEKFAGFNPLIFLMALGAGGIAVAPFAFLQYTFEHGAGLVKYSQVGGGFLFRSLEGVMIVFAVLHFVLMGILIRDLSRWIRVGGYNEILYNPLKNSGLVAPFIAVVMSMNVLIGPVRFFVSFMADNLQVFMLPALVVWGIIWVALMFFEFELLRISFVEGFDVQRISFGWLLHPFALGMLTVTGTGIAAMAKVSGVAHVAAFMSLVSGSMGLFLLVVKLVAIFKSHFAQGGLPAKEFLPSFLIVIPNVTLYAISAFRLGHYLEAQFGFHLGAYFLVVMTSAFAFELWYLGFGLVLLRDYFAKDFGSGEYYVAQWGLVCPVVAVAVLGSFVYKVFLASSILYAFVLFALLVSVVLFFVLFKRWVGSLR
jgi:hypothetical protein